jgi:hypothetical protein
VNTVNVGLEGNRDGRELGKSDVAALLTGLLEQTGLMEYRVVMRDGRLLSWTASNEMQVASEGVSAYMSLREAARELQHTYHWLSRNWRHLGLRPSRVGRVLFFSRDAIHDLIRRHVVSAGRGRPRVLGTRLSGVA